MVDRITGNVYETVDACLACAAALRRTHRAKRMQIAFPMPDAPPVTKHVLSANRCALSRAVAMSAAAATAPAGKASWLARLRSTRPPPGRPPAPASICPCAATNEEKSEQLQI